MSPNPWGQNFRPNFVSLGGFQAPPTKMSYTTPHHIPNYEILQKEKKMVNYPFNDDGNDKDEDQPVHYASPI